MTEKSQRFSKADWITIGEDLLKQEGAENLVVDRLCEKAGRTKGSFYHHFGDLPSFLTALIDRWEECNTLAVIEKASHAADPDSQLGTLNTLVLALDLELEIAIRQLAGRNSFVEQKVLLIDQKRLQFLEQLYCAMERPFPISPQRIAQLEYSAFLGSILLWPKLPGPERAELSLSFAHLLAKATSDS